MAVVNNKFMSGTKAYDVVSFEEYVAKPELYEHIDTAVATDSYVYPVRSRTDNRPGLYQKGAFYHFRDPETDDEKDRYSIDNVVDFRNQKKLEGVIAKQNALRDQERVILTTPDNIYIPIKLPNDSPAMKGLKEAIERKHIDLDKYESRFGNNYANDKRILVNTDITLSKLTTMSNALDLGLKLTITDKSPDVANPIKGKIEVDLLGNTLEFIPEETGQKE